jgi:hypothetical protein
MSMIEPVTRLDDLVSCPFFFTDPKFQRYKALDGHYYCSPEHASAMYMERFDAKLRAMR